MSGFGTVSLSNDGGTTRGDEPMYKALSIPELAALQGMLYAATEDAYMMASLAVSNQDWMGHYQPLHVEVARDFLEAGQELLARLGRTGELTATGPEYAQIANL
jgi:hypothetical protein